jgi:hypothetical protein
MRILIYPYIYVHSTPLTDSRGEVGWSPHNFWEPLDGNNNIFYNLYLKNRDRLYERWIALSTGDLFKLSKIRFIYWYETD